MIHGTNKKTHIENKWLEAHESETESTAAQMTESLIIFVEFMTLVNGVPVFRHWFFA